jgi:hypothetical protein
VSLRSTFIQYTSDIYCRSSRSPLLGGVRERRPSSVAPPLAVAAAQLLQPHLELLVGAEDVVKEASGAEVFGEGVWCERG